MDRHREANLVALRASIGCTSVALGGGALQDIEKADLCHFGELCG